MENIFYLVQNQITRRIMNWRVKQGENVCRSWSLGAVVGRIKDVINDYCTNLLLASNLYVFDRNQCFLLGIVNGFCPTTGSPSNQPGSGHKWSTTHRSKMSVTSCAQVHVRVYYHSYYHACFWVIQSKPLPVWWFLRNPVTSLWEPGLYWTVF